MKSRFLIVAGLATLGLADAAYLSYERLTGGSLVCPVTGTGCDIVQTSWYAAPYGVPVAYIGLFGYILMIVLAVLAHTNRTAGKFSLVTALKAIVVSAVTVSILLTGLQAFVIQAFCFWCLVSAMTNLAAAAVTFVPASWFSTTTKEQPRRQKGRKPQQRSHRGLIVTLLSILLLALAVAVFASRSSATAPVQANKNTPNVSVAYPLKGDVNAPVTVVVYSDYQCPACSAFALEFEPGFDRAYVATGKVKVEFRDFPLSQHANAVKAAMAARIAGDQGQYWKMHDLLFAKQGEWEKVPNPDTLFVRYAGQLGLDTGSFALALKNNTHRDEVVASGIAAMKANVDSTPTILVDGQKVSSWTSISAAVDAAIAASPTTR
ncbi:MAG: hypothetical protein RI947_1538 [Candidatus Parcubacteria bacterium]